MTKWRLNPELSPYSSPLIRSESLTSLLQLYSIHATYTSLCTSLSEPGRLYRGEAIYCTAISNLDPLAAPTPNHVPLVIERYILPPQRPLHHRYLPSNQARSCPAQIHYKMNISNKGEDHDAMANRKYIHWQDEGVEKIPPNETEDIQAVADQINAMQKAQYNSHRHCYTG